KLDTRNLYYGAGLLYHFQNYDSISNENDFIIDSCFKISTNKHFSFLIKGGFHFKLTDVFVLDDYLTDKCPSLVFYFEKLFDNGMEIYWNFGSHDNYRYPLFVSPQYTFGLAYTSRNKIRISADGEIRFSDQFTTAPYVNMLVLRSSFRVSF
ncbi:MAG: hypothetical protein K6F69_11355, partial [Treponema sp.]|nr:hypothetical protein [Treponema sp.]